MKHSYCGFRGYFIIMPPQLYFHYPYKDKLCTKCGETKPVSMFSQEKVKTESGIRILYKYCCKTCINKYVASRRIPHPKVLLDKEYKKQKYKDHRILYEASLSEEKKQEILQKKRDAYYSNREKSLENSKKWKQENKGRADKARKEYLDRNKEWIRKRTREYVKKRTNTDPLFKLKMSLRGRIRGFIKGKGMVKKDKTSEMILGAPYSIVKKHLERNFKKGMSWDNHGFGSDKWHIDHIIPLSSAKTENEVYGLLHYSNLQPLWSKENRQKSDKMPNVQVALRI